MIFLKPESGRSGPPPRQTKERKTDMQDKNNRKHTPTQRRCAARLRIKQNEIFRKNPLPRLLD